MTPTEFIREIKERLTRKADRRARLIENRNAEQGMLTIDPDSIEWNFDYIVSDETFIDEGMLRQIVRFVVYSKDVWYEEDDTAYLSKEIVRDLPRIMKEI